MSDLKTTYMGIEMANPVMVAACSLSGGVDTIRRIEECGAGGLVIKSLFEEQIRHEEGTLDSMQDLGNVSPEAITFFPQMPPAGAREHLMWVERARAAVRMPLIASLNAVTPEGWVGYALKLAETGVDGLELNTYAVQADLDREAADIEQTLIDTVTAIRAETSLPLAVKLSPFYTSVANLVKRLEVAGATSVVLFNRFYQLDIDPERQELMARMTWSSADEQRLAQRWIALLYGRVGLDLVGNTGVHTGSDIVRYLLAGASVVQVAGILYRRGVGHLRKLLEELDAWMARHEYGKVEDFRGKLSQAHHPANPAVFERAQYFDFLLNANAERIGADEG